METYWIIKNKSSIIGLNDLIYSFINERGGFTEGKNRYTDR
jgi:hypothetical protein